MRRVYGRFYFSGLWFGRLGVYAACCPMGTPYGYTQSFKGAGTGPPKAPFGGKVYRHKKKKKYIDYLCICVSISLPTEYKSAVFG